MFHTENKLNKLIRSQSTGHVMSCQVCQQSTDPEDIQPPDYLIGVEHYFR